MSSTVSLIAFPNIVLSTTGAPANSFGINGQFAWDSDAKILYGPKANGVWPAGVNLAGPAGAAGPANSLTIGTVTTGSPAAATITGTAPNQTLNLTIPPGPPGGLTARQTTTVTTTSINVGATWTGTVTLAPVFALLKVGLDFPGWLRVYPTASDRTNDATRLQNEDPDATVTAEIATSGNQELAPYRSGVIGSNLETPVTSTQYLALRNLDTVARTFEIKFRWVQLEA